MIARGVTKWIGAAWTTAAMVGAIAHASEPIAICNTLGGDKTRGETRTEARSRNLYWQARCNVRGGRREHAIHNWRELIAKYPMTFHGQLAAAAGRGGTRRDSLPAIDWALVNAIIQVESSWDRNAVSQRGAVGLMQVMPATARGLTKHDPTKCLTNEKCNIEVGVRYLKKLCRELKGDLLAVLYGYNAGPKRAHKWVAARQQDPVEAVDRVRIGETRRYLRKVLARLWAALGREHRHSYTLKALADLRYPQIGTCAK